ncbi:MAG TPA: helix-turn-helix domain-containing protein [Candidatus Limnocylindrales bacterium]
MSPSSNPARSAAPADDARDWLSLGPASRLVGVDPDTLRRWADDGRLPAFTTPGGHRRFERRDLERVMLSRRQAPARRRLAALGATTDRMNRAYARSYHSPADGRAVVGDRFDDADREAFREEGRRLLSSLMAYLDATTPNGRARSEADAVAAARATAARLALGGASVPEAAAAFIAARRPFFAELSSLGRRRSLDVASLTALYDEAVAVLDRLLVEFLAAFTPSRPTDQGVPA